MHKAFVRFVVLLSALLASGAHAALVSTRLDNVSILGSIYDVTFWQDSSGYTTFNDVFGAAGSPVLTFGAAQAHDAAAELLAAVNASHFHMVAATASPDFNYFNLVSGYTANEFQFFVGAAADSVSPGLRGEFPGNRSTTTFVTSFATFERVSALPEPGMLALTLAALLGVGAARHRKLRNQR